MATSHAQKETHKKPTPNHDGSGAARFAASAAAATSTELNVDPPPQIELSDPEPNPGHPGMTTSASANITNSVQSSFSLVNPVWGAQVDPHNGFLSFTPEWSQLNAFTLTVQAKNIDGETDTDSVSVTVANANPTINTLPNRTAHPGSAINFQVNVTDLDNDSLSYSIDDPPYGAQVDPTNGSFTWTPEWSQVGPHTLTFRVKDPSDGAGATRSCVIDVRNEAPRLKDRPPANVHAGVEIAFAAELDTPTNPEDVGDSAHFSLVNPPAGAQIDFEGNFRWTPGWNQIRSHNITIRAKDLAGAVGSKTYVINVQNNAPVLTNVPSGSVAVSVGSTYGFSVEVEPTPDQGSLRFYLIDPPYGASIDPSYGYFSWTPEESQEGSHIIRIRVIDPAGLFDEESFTINVS